MYHVSAQGVDERMINVHYYYYHERLSLDGHSRVQRSCGRPHIADVISDCGVACRRGVSPRSAPAKGVKLTVGQE